MTEEDIIQLIKEDKWMMDVLKNIDSLHLNDWWIGAGFVRSKVWDSLHNYQKRTPLPDIDIIYFDQRVKPIEDEKEKLKVIKNKMPNIKWSITNTAYRHLKLNREPYINSTEALSEWVETATCIGVRIEKAGILLNAPWGIGDLVNLKLRPSPKYKNNLDLFYERIEKKEWVKKWPKLKIVI